MTLEKRVGDLEDMVHSIPDILNVRFARVDRELAEIKETLAVYAQRFTVIERKLDKLDDMDRKLDTILSRLG